MTDISTRLRRRLMGGLYADQEITGDYRNSQAYNAHFKRCIFKNAKMDVSNFSGSTFDTCTFLNCTLRLCDFRRCRISHTSFLNCDLDQSAFDASIIESSDFNGRAEYASLCGANLSGVYLGLQLHGADLRFASSANISYEANLWGASINVSCAQFLNAELDERSVMLFAGLLAKTKGNDAFRGKLWALIPKRYRSILDRIAASETGLGPRRVEEDHGDVRSGDGG